jgi:hypothetical protein
LHIGNRSWVERKANPMLKILTSTKDELEIVTLIGRIEGENLEELQRLLGSETGGRNLILDLKDVTLVDQSAIQFFARCEADSVTLENIPAYISAWIVAERRRNKSLRP